MDKKDLELLAEKCQEGYNTKTFNLSREERSELRKYVRENNIKPVRKKL